MVVAALFLGLLAGAGVFVWRMRSHPAPEAPIQAKAVEQPPVSAAAAPPEPEPVPATPVAPGKPIVTTPEHGARVNSPSRGEEPAPPVASEAPPEPKPGLEASPTPAASVVENRRKAVQENDTLTGPALSPDATPAAAPEPAQTAPPTAPQVKTAIRYNGPLSGVATWTGKLEKGQVLTITGGTPSMGVLSGAGLPGVPVHITVDQTNLGFAVMPNASNGYLTVALRSHAKHGQITIHWSVVQ